MNFPAEEEQEQVTEETQETPQQENSQPPENQVPVEMEPLQIGYEYRPRTALTDFREHLQSMTMLRDG